MTYHNHFQVLITWVYVQWPIPVSLPTKSSLSLTHRWRLMLLRLSAISTTSGGCGNVSCPVDGWEEIYSDAMPVLEPCYFMRNDYLKKLNTLAFNHHGQGLDLQQQHAQCVSLSICFQCYRDDKCNR